MNATKWFATIMSCLTTLTLWDRGLLMDDSTLSLTHTFPSGERVKKAISGELSLEIYNILLPYFEKNRS